MSKSSFRFSGRLTAFHASEAGGLVICMDAAALSEHDLAEVRKISATGEAVVEIEAEATGDGGEADS